MTLSNLGWMNGLSIVGVIISSCGFALFFIYKSKKTDAKLLIYISIVGIFFGLQYLGYLIDFITILLTNNNMNNPNGLNGVLSWVWLPPGVISFIYLAGKLLIPEKKWHLVSIYLVIGVIFELFILLDPMGSFTFIYPDSTGEDLINTQFTFGSPASIIFIIINLSFITFWGFGFLYKGVKSTGKLRKKFLLLSIGSFYTIIFSIIDSLTPLSTIIFIVRFCTVSGVIIMYFGLREEPAESKKLHSKKEVKVEEAIFRLTKKPAQITEEEVTFHREKKICLICKGKALKFTYICPDCEALYCENCARALSSLENACWVCNAQIVDSKPSKPFRRDEDAIELEKK